MSLTRGRLPDHAEVRLLFDEYAALPKDDPRALTMRARIIETNIPLARYLAARFGNRGEPMDDLTQVAIEGLIKAVDRFDPDRGVEFASFAGPTIVGEVKRHFRDHGWAVRVPRRLQEMRMAVSGATGPLSQQLGRAPTVAELAAYLQVSEEDVLEGMEAAAAYAPVPLNASSDNEGDDLELVDRLGVLEPGIEGVDNRESLKRLLAQLPERERTILGLRFYDELTQSEIAERMGISQMHVSRLLSRTLGLLREGMLAEA